MRNQKKTYAKPIKTYAESKKNVMHLNLMQNLVQLMHNQSNLCRTK